MSVATDLLSLVESELCTLADRERVIACNMLRRKLDELDPPKPVGSEPAALKPMSAGEAGNYGAEVMGYGQYAESRRDDVPREYLEWLVDAKRAEWRDLRRYLMYGEKVEHDE